MHSQTGVSKLHLSFAVNGPGTSLTQEDGNENQVWAERIAQCYSLLSIAEVLCARFHPQYHTHVHNTHAHTVGRKESKAEELSWSKV